jgi:hypothetical protein
MNEPVIGLRLRAFLGRIQGSDTIMFVTGKCATMAFVTYSCMIEGLEQPFEVVLPVSIVAAGLAAQNKLVTLSNEVVLNYDVGYRDAYIFALAYYYCMPTKMKEHLKDLANGLEWFSLRAEAIDYWRFTYEA